MKAGGLRAGDLEAGDLGLVEQRLVAAAQGMVQRRAGLAGELLMMQLEAAVETRARRLAHLRQRPRDHKGRVVAVVADETVRAYLWMIEQIPLPGVLERATAMTHISDGDIELLYAS